MLESVFAKRLGTRRGVAKISGQLVNTLENSEALSSRRKSDHSIAGIITLFATCDSGREPPDIAALSVDTSRTSTISATVVRDAAEKLVSESIIETKATSTLEFIQGELTVAPCRLDLLHGDNHPGQFAAIVGRIVRRRFLALNPRQRLQRRRPSCAYARESVRRVCQLSETQAHSRRGQFGTPCQICHAQRRP